MGDVRPSISEHAARLRALHDEIDRTFRRRPHGPGHHAACALFHASYDALALPGGLGRGLERLKRHDPGAVEVAVQFLEEDPWFFRSGYIKEEMVRHLKHAPLSDGQRVRLASVIARCVSRGTGRVCRHLAKLVPAVTSAELAHALLLLARSDDPGVRWRAGHALRVLEGSAPLTPGEGGVGRE